MPTYDSYNNPTVGELADKQTKGAFLSKVFGMMFILLLITTLVAGGVGYGAQFLMVEAANAGNDELAAQIFFGLIATLGISLIVLIVMSFVLPITFIRGKHNIIVPLIIYVVVMGLLLSSFTIIFDWVILVEAFGITALIFGIMAFLGYISKGRLAGIGVILLGLALGAMMLSLMNWIMILVGGIKAENVTISWIVSLLVFAFLMFITLYDVHRITRIAENGATNNNNLVHYCAYILYSDFISILIRVVYYLAVFTRRR